MKRTLISIMVLSTIFSSNFALSASYIATDNDGAYGAFTTGYRSAAVGYSAKSTGEDSLALGQDVISGGIKVSLWVKRLLLME